MLFDEGAQPTGDAGVVNDDQATPEPSPEPSPSDEPATEGDDTQTV